MRKASLQEVLVLLCEDNRITPEALEHAVWAVEAPTIDLSGRDGSDAPVRRAERWRAKSPMTFPMLPGSRRGFPAVWTRWVLDRSEELPDDALRPAVRTAAFAVTDLGASVTEAVAALAHVTAAKLGKRPKPEGPGWKMWQDHVKSERRGGVPLGKDRVPVPAPPAADDARRARGRPPRGSSPEDAGLLRYLPGYVAWLRRLEQPCQGAGAAVRAVLSGLPSVEVVPTADELREAVRLRRGKIRSRGATLAWEGFRIHVRTATANGVNLPALGEKAIPAWKAPGPVALAVRRLLGSRPVGYRGLQHLRRRDVVLVGHADVVGGRFPCGYAGGVFAATRELTRAEVAWVRTLLAWAPGGTPDDPLFPAGPETPVAVNGRLIWNRVRFEGP